MLLHLTKLTLAHRHPLAVPHLICPQAAHLLVYNAFDASTDARPLYRMDGNEILIQSLVKGDWSHVRGDIGSVESKIVRLTDKIANMQYAFRVDTIPSTKSNGKHLVIRDPEAKLAWFERKLAQGGAEALHLDMEEFSWRYDPSYGDIVDGVKARTMRHDHLKSVSGCRFSGVLSVNDPEAFTNMVARGLGNRRAFGCGLLSIAPVGAALSGTAGNRQPEHALA